MLIILCNHTWDVAFKRTARVKLAIPDDRRNDLKRTMLTFQRVARRFADRGWERDEDGYVITFRTRLQSLVYKQIREDTSLHSDLCIGAVNLAADSLRSAIERMKAGKNAGKPTFTAPTVEYNTNAVSYFTDDDDQYCTLAAYNGRIRAGFVYPPGKDCPQVQYLEGDEWEPKGATLHYERDDGEYYLHVR